MFQNQNVAILIDGSNVEVSLFKKFNVRGLMLNYDSFIPEIIKERNLTKLYYFREGTAISDKFTSRLKESFYGICEPCGKSADMKLAVKAWDIHKKVDTIIIISGDIDYSSLVVKLKHEGLRVEVICVEESGSKALLKIADSFMFIEEKHLYKFEK